MDYFDEKTQGLVDEMRLMGADSVAGLGKLKKAELVEIIRRQCHLVVHLDGRLSKAAVEFRKLHGRRRRAA